MRAGAGAVVDAVGKLWAYSKGISRSKGRYREPRPQEARQTTAKISN